ncbi:hypothetical protein N5J23_15865 [Comamonas aquatica]|jgi:hypothetical protein|uniref:Uncharacterized protein n=1 Tax=Comamonas aquatica TaxID=225991 RepID=A0AA42W471_9BURK|nr:BPSL0761 family protein [Comamonas aquatica]MDH1427373.1 hypothetical protein [Comamonas aquatica]MDH1607258.1 hypothetical protein [Comamonas aquatica]MDH1619050.1 hypothetical protein [Comamonas aquatica]MDH2006995.1 hypothetical protein [Comamonas aquatica]
MTMPDERARALRFAGEILREMLTRQDVPEHLKRQAQATLRHYPDPLQLQWMIEEISRQSGDGPPWLAKEECI